MNSADPHQISQDQCVAQVAFDVRMHSMTCHVCKDFNHDQQLV
jgi:hypothetical protein